MSKTLTESVGKMHSDSATSHEAENAMATFFKEMKIQLTSEDVIPFDRKVKKELTNNVELPQVNIDEMTAKLTIDLLPSVDLADESDTFIMFLGEIISVKHSWGKRLVDICLNLSKLTVYQFKSHIHNLIGNIMSDISAVNYSDLFKINTANLMLYVRNFGTKQFKSFKMEVIIQALFQSMYQIAAHLDKDILDNSSN